VRIALDTNILAYAEGVNGTARQEAAFAVLAPLEDAEVVIPVQVLGELFTVLVRKGGRDTQAAQLAVAAWAARASLVATTDTMLQDGMVLATQHRLAIWDAIILAAAAEAGCGALYSEDMQPGFTWRGVTVQNPFTAGRRSPP